MKRPAAAAVSALALVGSVPFIVQASASAEPSKAAARLVPAVTVPALLTISGEEATVTPIPGTDRFRLRVTGTGNEVTWLTDHPARRAGHMRVDNLAAGWSRTFRGDAPTSALTMRAGGRTYTYVVDLSRPSYANGVLAFTIEPVIAAMGAIPARAQDVDLMIDEVAMTLPRDPADHPRVSRGSLTAQLQPRALPAAPTGTASPTANPMATATPSPSPTGSARRTWTASPMATPFPAATPWASPTGSARRTWTATPTATPSYTRPTGAPASGTDSFAADWDFHAIIPIDDSNKFVPDKFTPGPVPNITLGPVTYTTDINAVTGPNIIFVADMSWVQSVGAGVMMDHHLEAPDMLYQVPEGFTYEGRPDLPSLS